jgi:tRNA pseudouridine38-40 synthase
MYEAGFTRRGELIIFDVRANAFLQHMVRNIMGSMLAVGEGRRSPEWIDQLLESKDRTRASMTAAPAGLYLVEVGYPEPYRSLGQKVLPAILCAAQ